MSLNCELPAALAKLKDSAELKGILENIDIFSSKNKSDVIIGPLDDDPEYKIIVDATNMTVEIEKKIAIIHQFIKDVYSKRFPELESLVLIALEYIGTVQTLENYVDYIMDRTKNNQALKEILTPVKNIECTELVLRIVLWTIMVVVNTTEASTNEGTVLPEQELSSIIEACRMALDLNRKKMKIFDFVELRMTLMHHILFITAQCFIISSKKSTTVNQGRQESHPAPHLPLVDLK